MFLKDKRGSSEAITFAFIIPIIMYVVFSFTPPIFAMYDYFSLISVRNQALNLMEVSGGLTEDIENFIITSLDEKGLDTENVIISSNTKGRYDYGSILDLTLEYKFNYDSYSMLGINILKNSSEKTMKTEGKTISLYFEQDT